MFSSLPVYGISACPHNRTNPHIAEKGVVTVLHPVTAFYDVRKRKWLRLSGFRQLIQTRRIEEIISCLEEVEEQVLRHGLYAAGFVAYEAAPAFDPALQTDTPDDNLPLLWFALYENAEQLGAIDSDSSVTSLTAEGSEWQPSIGEEEYRRALAEIRDYISRGCTYQVNFTLRLQAKVTPAPWDCFRHLVNVQGSTYPVYLENEDWAVCSASPELFFTRNGSHLVTRPMKGTTARGRTWEEDMTNKERLLNSEKERAENVMIVDMARNDLGRIADTGSVKVTELFVPEKYPTVWQLTSTVEGRTRAALPDIFQALFPAASITGAPKPRTMRIITELETTPRNVYTGSAGFMAPDGYSQFNVAIRTLVVDKQSNRGIFGTGGGIVWDSLDSAEYAEWGTKARILHYQQRPRFALLETILWSSGNGFFLLDKHLQRLVKSADYFDFNLDLQAVKDLLEAKTGDLKQGEYKIRLLVYPDRSPECQIAPLSQSAPTPRQPARAGIAAKPVDAGNVFLYHKTTNRRVYDEAKGECPDCDDVILYNKEGYITESTIANVVVDSCGELLTPPVSAGLLNGVFRQYLLDAGRIKEKGLRLDDLRQADRIYLINSVRKWRRAVLK